MVSRTAPISTPGIRNLEDVFERIGGFGRFQFLLLILLLSFEIPAAFTVFSPIFVGASPKDWRCNGEFINQAEICTCNGTLESTMSSIVVEWGLVCHYSWVSDFSTTMQMLGMLFGNIVTGHCADWYGRRWSFFGTIIVLMVGTVLSALSPNIVVYIAARFICGMGYSGYTFLSATYAMEFMTPKWRSVCVSFGPFGEGLMFLGVLGYYFQDSWRTLLMITAFPYISIFFIFPFLHESPRWLLAKGRGDDAIAVFRSIAKTNRYNTTCLDVEEYVKITLKLNRSNSNSTPSNTSYIQFLKNKEMRVTALFLVTVWCMWVIMYFGISFNIKNVGGNPFLNIAYLGFCDALGYPCAYFVGLKCSRRRLVALFMSGAAPFLVSLAILQLFHERIGPLEATTLILALIGKFFAAGSRSSLRLFTGESFPTSVRNIGFGLVGVAAAFIGLLTPQLAYIGSYAPAAPLFVFATCSLVGAVVSILLQETKGQPLQEGVTPAKTKPKNVEILKENDKS